MFDTMKVAQKIREARNAMNMTQMALADEMGVSCQAVSNWERGNSMPDISKLEDLCKTLDLSVEELLGMETKTAVAVNQVLNNEPLTVEDLKEVAPILPPEQMKEKTEEIKESVKNFNEEWKTYDFPGYTSVNVIFNKGSNQNQTADLYCPSNGYYWFYNNSFRMICINNFF